MITYHRKKDFGKPHLDLNIVHAFEEAANYKRSFQLPYNVLACRVAAEEKGKKKGGSFIYNNVTGKRYELLPGGVHFIPYGLPITICNLPDTIGYSLHFTLEQYPGADLFRGCRNILDLSHLANTGDFIRIFQEENLLKARCLAEELIFRISAEILPEERESPKWRFAGLLQEAREKMDALWNVEMLAEKAGMSAGAFSREFSGNMECTAKEFLQNELLHKAMLLLQQPGMGVQDAAEKLHFSSPFYFSKFFKRRCGISPREYRKEYHTGKKF